MSRRNQSEESERSPLIAALPTHNDEDVDEEPISTTDDFELEDPIVESKSTIYLILLTLCIGGLQIVWSVELSNGSPYLLSLGMSKALLAFVWLAGPMTGVLVQPYVGIVSDRCRISWGKRKPFMIAGTLGTVAASLLLAYAKTIIRVFGFYGLDAPYQGSLKTATIVWATVMMWCLDFSINTVQAAIRAFIVDNAPAHQQESANSWASRIVGVGNVLGYIFGYLNLPKYFGFLGNEQFKVLCTLASIVLSLTVLISIVSIKERDPRQDPAEHQQYEGNGLVVFFKQTFAAVRRLPPQTRSVCAIQFAQWIGWFPFLFYITTYVGQLYVDPRLNPDMSEDDVDKLWGKATRVGTFALLIYAIVSFAANIILPFLIVPTYRPTPNLDRIEDLVRPISPTVPIGTRYRSASSGELTFARTVSQNSVPTMGSLHTHMKGAAIPEPTSMLQRCLKKVQVPGLTLRKAWLMAQLLFSVCMFSTFLISSVTGASIMTAVVGLSWSLTLWAPFALISAEIAQRDELRRKKQRLKLQHDNLSDDDVEALNQEEDKAGIILGLHNVAVSAPQVLSTLISSAVFKALQKDRRIPGDNSVAWTLRIGGAATLIAAFLTWRMQEAGEDEDKDGQPH